DQVGETRREWLRRTVNTSRQSGSGSRETQRLRCCGNVRVDVFVRHHCSFKNSLAGHGPVTRGSDSVGTETPFICRKKACTSLLSTNAKQRIPATVSWCRQSFARCWAASRKRATILSIY